MDNIKLVLDYLFTIDDVVPFLSVLHAKFFAKRRISEIVLNASRLSRNVGGLRITMRRGPWYTGPTTSPPIKSWARPREVFLSEDHGWRLRFDWGGVISVSPECTLFDLSIECDGPPSGHTAC